MSEATLEEKYNSLRRLHESTNEAVSNLQEQVKLLQTEIAMRDAKLINCQNALEINKEIMRNALLEQNRIQEEYGKEIQVLRSQLKSVNQKI